MSHYSPITPALAARPRLVLRGPARFIVSRLLLGLLALLIVECADTLATEAAEPGSRWATVRRALVRLYDTDPAVVREAEQELDELGVSANSIALGKRLVDPDARRRAELAGSLAQLDAPTRSTVIRTLSNDEETSVRVALVEAARDLRFERTERDTFRTLAADDPDARVRGYARLLVADWPAEQIDASRASNPMPVRAAALAAANAGASNAPRVRNADVEELAAPPSRIRPTAYENSPGPPRFEQHPLDVVAGSSSTDDRFAPSFGDRFRRPSQDTTANVVPPVAATTPSSGLKPFWVEDSSARDAAPVRRAGYDDEVQPLFDGPLDPDLLNRPLGDEPIEDPLEPPPLPDFNDDPALVFEENPYGFAGPSGILPSEGPNSPHFMPIDDRWRLGFEPWDRYGKKHPNVDDYPGVEGHWWDPYNLNVLKGDYPIIGQHTFLRTTATSFTTFDYRETPVATTPFESTKNANQEEFFGDPAQQFFNENLILQLDLFHGSAGFKPLDWQVRLSPVLNFNTLDVNELGVVNPDVRRGTRRSRDHIALQEYFVEAKLADLGPDYDFVSVRAGNQLFNSDFRGHIFFDVNRGVRLFGSRFGNRDQFNLAFFDMVEKETNSGLNTFDDRHQNVFIANYTRQDFVFPGYTAQASLHYNDDQASFLLDRNDFLVRPDPVGVFQPHRVQATYLGFAGEGHIERFNVSHVTYWALGKDNLNPLAGREQEIDAYLAAIELSYDRDWIRFRTSLFYQSGDDDLNDDKAEGFDTIMDDVNFAGGNFSFWQRNKLQLFGVNVTQQRSLVNDLRSSKTQGQANFVNPGLVLVNGGMDFELTPKLKLITNVNYLWFDSTVPLEVFTFQDRIDPDIGLDSSLGIEYRPLLNDNVIMLFGFSNLIPGQGFVDLFGRTDPFTLENAGNVKADPLYAAFFELVMQY